MSYKIRLPSPRQKKERERESFGKADLPETTIEREKKFEISAPYPTVQQKLCVQDALLQEENALCTFCNRYKLAHLISLLILL